MNNQNDQKTNQPQTNADASGHSHMTLSNISQLMTRRQVGAINTTQRCCSQIVHTLSSHNKSIIIGRAELDTLADTSGVNNIARALEFTNQVAEVSGFANSLQP